MLVDNYRKFVSNLLQKFCIMPTPAQEAANTHTSPERLKELWLHSPKLGIILASNENAPAELLQELAVNEDEQIRQAVCSNPNTPTDILFKLGEEFPQELFDNPVFSLLLLENPNLIEDIPESTLVSLLKSPSIPDSYLQWAIQSKRASILFAVVMNPKINKDDLQKLINNSQFYWWSQQISNITKLHVNWSSEMRSGWEEAALSVVRKQQIFKDTIRNELLSEFSLWQMAQNVETPAETLLELAQSQWVLIREAVALNPKAAMIVYKTKKKAKSADKTNTPATLIEKLLVDKNPVVKVAVAKNPDTPVNILEQLANDIFYRHPIHIASVKNLLLRHPERAAVYIENCTKDSPEPSFSRFFVLLNHFISSKMLAKHFRSSSWLERYVIATNPNTPVHIRQRLAEDANRIVRAAAKSYLSK